MTRQEFIDAFLIHAAASKWVSGAKHLVGWANHVANERAKHCPFDDEITSTEVPFQSYCEPVKDEAVEKQDTLYDWSKVDEWAQWVATDGDGSVYCYLEEPRKLGNCWDYKGGRIRHIGARPDLAKDWMNSLEQRPA
jgi:hypothetical protein